MKLGRPFPDPFNRVLFRNARGTRYLGAAAFIGKGRNARAHMHASAGVMDVPADFNWSPDPVRLARQFEVDMFTPSQGRIWTIDEGEVQGGYFANFDGAKMCWIGVMVAEDVVEHFHGPSYAPALVYRLTKWTWRAGKPVFLLREPDGPTWVMQEMTADIDKTLSIDNLGEIGRKLKLPPGWKFETRVLDSDLVLDTMKIDGWASIIRDDLHCTYQACGYGADTSHNYVP